jgi:hypothetical protein
VYPLDVAYRRFGIVCIAVTHFTGAATDAKYVTRKRRAAELPPNPGVAVNPAKCPKRSIP